MKTPESWYREFMRLEDFLLGMLELGSPIEISYVGVFDETGRGSRRDMDLPMHRDGEYSAKLAKAQGGTYVEQPNVDFVGMYCLRSGGDCVTILKAKTDAALSGQMGEQEIKLFHGEALIFDNTKVMHGRRGLVGDRILLRIWISKEPQP